MPQSNRELAELGAVHRTIPRRFTDVAVTASSGVQSLGALSGKWIYLRALTSDVTIRLGAGNAIVNLGEGFIISSSADAPLQEFYVDPSDDFVLNHRAAGIATLRILHD